MERPTGSGGWASVRVRARHHRPPPRRGGGPPGAGPRGHTGDETRRRIERDLHDGTQQRLVSLALMLRATEAKIAPDMEDVRSELSHTARGLAAAVENLQEIARGIHPAVLSSGGLNVALRGLGRRAGLPVELDVDVPHRLPDPVEVATPYLVSEALTNAAKHARASTVRVHVRAVETVIDLTISDDGVGGADPAHGSGLRGLTDRVERRSGARLRSRARPAVGPRSG
jgi:signal transduction histidine kinase